MLAALKIKATFNNIYDAVKAAGIDLSYSPEIAEREMKYVDLGTNGGSKKVYLTEDNEIFYEFDADIKLLNSFHPFSRPSYGEAFYPVTIEGNAIKISTTDLFSREHSKRRDIANEGIRVTTFIL